MSFDIENRRFVYDEEKWKTLLNENYELKAPTVVEVDNGIVLPLRKHKNYEMVFEGGVCDEKFNFVSGDYSEYPKTYGYLSCAKSYIPEEPVHIRHETVIFGGVLINGFGLSLLSNISRLWYLADHPETPYKFVFLENKTWGKFTFFKVFEAAGLSKNRIELIEHTTQIDILDWTNMIFCGNKIDRTLYPDCSEVMWLRQENERLEKRVNRMLHRRIKKQIRRLKDWIKSLLKKGKKYSTMLLNEAHHF